MDDFYKREEVIHEVVQDEGPHRVKAERCSGGRVTLSMPRE